MSQPPPDTNPGWGDPTPPAAWASPSGSPADTSPSAVPPAPGPGPGQGAPGYGPGPAGHGPVPAFGPAPGHWRPPVLQPGIIPLRPLGLGEILDGTMKAVRFNPKVAFGLTAVVITACVTLATVLTAYLSGFFMAELRDALELDVDGGDSLILMLMSMYGTMPLLLIATPLLSGLLTVAVSKAVLGQKISVGEVVRSRRVWAVLGFSALVFVGTTIVLAAFVALFAAFVNAGGAGAAAALGLLLFGGLALLVGWAWLTVRTLLVTPALMLEGGRFWATIGRAWRLTRGSFWRLLGIYLLVYIALYVISQAISVPFSIVIVIVAALDIAWATLLVTGIMTILMYTVTIAFEAVLVALLYIDLRMRREGLDLELARAANEAPTP